MREQFLIERAPIGADAHRLVVPDRSFDNGAELAILLLLKADIARIDAVLVERLGASRMIGQELVADVVEIADDRHVDIHLGKPLFDVGNGGGRFVAIHRDAHNLRTGARQGCHLLRGGLGIGRIGIGHRLHHNRCPAADGYVADFDADRAMPGGRTGKRDHDNSFNEYSSLAENSRAADSGPARRRSHAYNLTGAD